MLEVGEKGDIMHNYLLFSSSVDSYSSSINKSLLVICLTRDFVSTTHARN